MKKLIIKEIDNYKYLLEDTNNNKYNFNIEFFIKEKPCINDYIYMNEELLNEYVLNFDYVDDIINDDKDLVILINNNRKIYLKRIYG